MDMDARCTEGIGVILERREEKVCFSLTYKTILIQIDNVDSEKF